MNIYNQVSSSSFYKSNNSNQKIVEEINKSSKNIKTRLSIISTIAIIGVTYSLNKEYFGAVLNTTSHVDMTIKILTISSLAFVILDCVALTLLKNKQLKEQENLNEKNILRLKNKINNYKQNTQNLSKEMKGLQKEHNEKLSKVENEYLNKMSSLKNVINHNKQKYCTEIRALEETHCETISKVKNKLWGKILKLQNKNNTYEQNEKNHLIKIETLQKESNQVKLQLSDNNESKNIDTKINDIVLSKFTNEIKNNEKDLKSIENELKKLTETFDKVGKKAYDDFEQKYNDFYYIDNEPINDNLKETELYKKIKSQKIKCETFSLIESYLQLKALYFSLNGQIHDKDVAVFKCQQKILTLKNQVMNKCLELNESGGPEFLFSFKNSLNKLEKKLERIKNSRENLKLKQQKSITLMEEIESFKYKTRSDIKELDRRFNSEMRQIQV